jgi:hypothetical protein
VSTSNRTGIFVVFLIGGIICFGAAISLTGGEKPDPAAAIVAALGGLACAVIVTGALIGLHPPQPRWVPSPPPPQQPQPQQYGGHPQQFPQQGQPGTGPQAFGGPPPGQP